MSVSSAADNGIGIGEALAMDNPVSIVGDCASLVGIYDDRSFVAVFLQYTI